MKYFSLDIAKCLLNKPRENLNDKQMLRILPGKYMTLDEQCQIMGYVKAYEVSLLNIERLLLYVSGKRNKFLLQVVFTKIFL